MPRMTQEDKKYRAEQDLRTLRQAQEVKADKSRVMAAARIAKAEMKALGKISGQISGRSSGRKK